MSVKIMGAIWDLDLPHELAWTLMAYADHADHDGRNCYPGNKLIAYKTGYSERTVQRCTAALVTLGILIGERAGGRGKTSVYRIDIARAPRKAARSEPEESKGDILTPFSAPPTELAERVTSEAERVTSETERVTSEAERVTSEAEKGDTAMAPQPSLTVIDPSSEPSGTARGREPENWFTFCQEGHRTLARVLNRENMRPPCWRLNADGLLECGIWEPGLYQAAKREPLRVSVVGQTAIKHLGRRVALSIVPAWEEHCSTAVGSFSSSSPAASATSFTPALSPG